jgi:hypothetical protein
MRWEVVEFTVHYDRQGRGYFYFPVSRGTSVRDLAIPLFPVEHGAKLLFHVKR